MIAIDTNILVYATRTEYSFHKEAHRAITELSASGQRWAIPWPCAHEFLSVVTNQKIHRPARFVGKRRGGPKSWPTGRLVHGIYLSEIVWAGRNRAVHSDEGLYRPEVLAVFGRLEEAYGHQFNVQQGDKVSRAREVGELLGWLDPAQFAEDVRALLA